MIIGFITTSRADFGIYIPLLNRIKNAEQHDYRIFAGGMHTSEKFGNSHRLIEEAGFQVHEKPTTLVDDDSPKGIGLSMAKTTQAYAKVWAKHGDSLDVVFALGDRFEMFAAASSIVPFNIPMAHLHGGETTLGSTDNKFRHAITAIADCHFTSHASHSARVVNILGDDKNVYNVGALAIEYMQNFESYTAEEFDSLFQFDLNTPFILTTYHPDTRNLGNEEKIRSLTQALHAISFPVLCTLPNADREGMLVREALVKYEREYPDKIKCFENLGQKGYMTAMKHCKFMLGNTSSGIIEAATFDKVVIDVGDRQKGRLAGENVIHVGHEAEDILKGVEKIETMPEKQYVNPYGDGNTSQKILDILEEL
jgi:GDP/UDP-N,N'-diacetylbacillosamine 2-epimerase (hydrolysing)